MKATQEDFEKWLALPGTIISQAKREVGLSEKGKPTMTISLDSDQGEKFDVVLTYKPEAKCGHKCCCEYHGTRVEGSIRLIKGSVTSEIDFGERSMFYLACYAGEELREFSVRSLVEKPIESIEFFSR